MSGIDHFVLLAAVGQHMCLRKYEYDGLKKLLNYSTIHQ